MNGNAPVQEDGILASSGLATDYSIQDIRILKNRGFYGVTVPVNLILPIPISYDNYSGGTTPYNCIFFIADRPYKVIQASGRCNGIASDWNFTVYLRKVASGVALGGATSCMTGSINFGSSTTANTVSTVTRSTATNYINNNGSSVLAEGDSLFWEIDLGTAVGCKNVCLSVLLRSI